MREIPVRPKILVVEDDPAVRRSMQLFLQGRGFDVRAYATGQSVLDDAAASDAAGMVADYQIESIDGIELLGRLRARGWGGVALLITGYPSEELERSATAAGFTAFFEKPLNQHNLIEALEHLTADRLGGR